MLSLAFALMQPAYVDQLRVSYAEGDDDRTLDLYSVVGGDPEAVTVVVGDPFGVAPSELWNDRSGAAVARVRYRQMTDDAPARPWLDVRDAVSWLQANGEGLGLDPDRITLVGTGFGALPVELVARAGTQAWPLSGEGVRVFDFVIEDPIEHPMATERRGEDLSLGDRPDFARQLGRPLLRDHWARVLPSRFATEDDPNGTEVAELTFEELLADALVRRDVQGAAVLIDIARRRSIVVPQEVTLSVAEALVEQFDDRVATAVESRDFVRAQSALLESDLDVRFADLEPLIFAASRQLSNLESLVLEAPVRASVAQQVANANRAFRRGRIEEARAAMPPNDLYETRLLADARRRLIGDQSLPEMPDWAEAIGFDLYGVWAGIVVGDQVIEMRWMPDLELWMMDRELTVAQLAAIQGQRVGGATRAADGVTDGNRPATFDFEPAAVVREIQELAEEPIPDWRLPTEAEWRRGLDRFSASRDINDYAVLRGATLTGPAPTASRLPNPLGFYDMVGNVAEAVEANDGWSLMGGTWASNRVIATRFVPVPYRNQSYGVRLVIDGEVR